MRIHVRVSWITAGLVVLSAALDPAQAEVVKRVSVDGIYDNNAYKFVDGPSDAITQTSFYLARRDTSAKTGVEYFYNGDFDLFVRASQRHFTAQRVGIAYVRQFGQARRLLSAGGHFGGRWDRAAYNYYDNLDRAVYANFKLNLARTTSLRTTYRLTLRKYFKLDASSFREHLASLALNTAFPTRTALKLEVSYGYKDYTMSRTVQPVAAKMVVLSGMDRNNGMGGQSGSGMGSGFQMGGGTMGGGMGPGSQAGGGMIRGGMMRGRINPGESGTEDDETSLVEPIIIQSGSPNKNQITLSLRVSQSLLSSTGVNVQYLRRINPSSGGRYQSGLGTGYVVEDDDLFDDRYDYEGHEISGGMSQLLPWGSKLTVDVGYITKDYRDKPALDLEGIPLGADRSDRKRYLSAGIEMPLGMALDVNLWYIYTTNTSNDPLYGYRDNHVVSVGVSREF
jgi:hypothetical protein